MKTNLPKQKSKQAILSLILLILVSFTNGYAQDTNITFDNSSASLTTAPACPLGGCTAQDVTFGDVYLGDAVGNLATLTYISANNPLYIWVKIASNSSKHDLLFQFDYLVGGVRKNFDNTNFVGSTTDRLTIKIRGNIITAGSKYRMAEITNYTAGQSLELQNIYLGWNTNGGAISSGQNISFITCNSPKCSSAYSGGIIIKTPLFADFSISKTCDGGTFEKVVYTSTSTGIEGNTNYSWLFPGAVTISPSSLSTSGPYTVTYSSAGPHSASLTVSDPLNAVIPNTKTINNINIALCCTSPVITNKTATICTGNSFSINPITAGSDIVPSGTTYTWSTPVSSPSGAITGGTSQITGATGPISQTLTNTTNSTATLTYTVTPKSESCTGTPFTITVTVTPKPTKVSTPVTICSGETYTWTVNGTAYTESGTYLVTNDGCTANQELVLTVTPKPTKVSTPVTICSGETYTWTVNGTAYTESGTYLVTNDGCTANQELVLTVTPKPTKVSTPVTICSGETYTWTVNGTAYTESGTYLVTNDGCTANQELVLTVTPKPTKVSTPVTICSGETYTWTVNGTAYTESGTYLVTNDGCTANQELVLTVTPKPTKVSTPMTICSGETYTWTVNGTAYTESGTYLVTNDGCTANQELVLTVTPKPTKVSTPVTICSGETYTWTVNGTAYTESGTYLVTNDGCTANQELVLTVTPKPTKVSTPVTICSGETYTWTVNGTAYTESGTYLVTNDGCTANQELVLTVTPKPTKVSTPVTICSGETYTWTVNGTAYTESGT
ncbi:PKD-like domain-containing protein, partial [Flavobacterium hiemivividum]